MGGRKNTRIAFVSRATVVCGLQSSKVPVQDRRPTVLLPMSGGDGFR